MDGRATRPVRARGGAATRSSLTDAEWAELAPLVPPAKPGGRPTGEKRGRAGGARRRCSTSGAREALALQPPAAGCAAQHGPQHLPRLRARLGVWEAIAAALVAAERRRQGRAPERTAASSTARPLGRRKGGAAHGPGGLRRRQADQGAQAPPADRHAGLPLRVVVHSAGIQDRDGAALVLEGLRERCPHLELVWADAGYLARQADAAVAAVPCLRLGVRSSAPNQKAGSCSPGAGSSSEPSLETAATARRLAEDYEAIVEAVLGFIHLATIQLLVRRLARGHDRFSVRF